MIYWGNSGEHILKCAVRNLHQQCRLSKLYGGKVFLIFNFQGPRSNVLCKAQLFQNTIWWSKSKLICTSVGCGLKDGGPKISLCLNNRKVSKLYFTGPDILFSIFLSTHVWECVWQCKYKPSRSTVSVLVCDMDKFIPFSLTLFYLMFTTNMVAQYIIVQGHHSALPARKLSAIHTHISAKLVALASW